MTLRGIHHVARIGSDEVSSQVFCTETLGLRGVADTTVPSESCKQAPLLLNQ